MNNFLLAIIPSAVFFAIKSAFLGIRFSDTNVYFYTATELLKGKLLYKDIFFTNLPLFPYISSLYAFLIKGKLDLYYLTATFEVIVIGALIFFLAFKKFGNRLYALICQSLYLFSFIILSTSDHQTGVFLASLFSMLAYFFYLKKQDVFAGLLLGAMVLTKAYYLPIAGAFFLYLFLKEKQRIVKTAMGLISICAVIMGLFFVSAGKDLIKDVLLYSLFRSQGIDKARMISFFIKHDLFFIFLLFFAVFKPKRNLLFFLIFVFSGLLIFFYRDVYYLYLNIVIPFLALAFCDFITWFEKKGKKYEAFLYFTIIFLLGLNLIIYLKDYAALQKLDNVLEVIKVIKKENPQYLYGAMEITPALAYLSGVPLLDNIIDTNDNLFYKGVLNAKILTTDAVSKKTIVVAKGLYYPANNIDRSIADAALDEEKILKHCTKIHAAPIKTEGLINTITIFKCY